MPGAFQWCTCPFLNVGGVFILFCPLLVRGYVRRPEFCSGSVRMFFAMFVRALFGFPHVRS